ncbi:MAG: hypothetical protein H0X34_07135 [Chthoniobacterales bacterium]|nr:hypothetical protein [Chthoniobacterales bacterium]
MNNEIDKKIRKGLPPRRDAASFQTVNDIVIPAGTVLRAIGEDEYAAGVGFNGIAGEFSVTVKPGAVLPAGSLNRVVAA